MKSEPLKILLVEDEPAHAEIVLRNFQDIKLANQVIHVSDGQVALDYLYRREEFCNPNQAPRPHLILLDLRLPIVDGLTVLKCIKSSPEISRIPVVVLTTSSVETDMLKAYDYHVNSYLVKPVDFSKFVELLKSIGYYWLGLNKFTN
jgi:CheY-like chemotaxis protein